MKNISKYVRKLVVSLLLVLLIPFVVIIPVTRETRRAFRNSQYFYQIKQEFKYYKDAWKHVVEY